MNNLIPVSDIMTKTVIALKRSDDLQKAEKLFKKHKIKHIPVVSSDVVIGMLSYSDLLKTSMANTSDDEHNVDAIVYNEFTIEQVMVKDVETISADTTIKEAAEILANRSYHALPVVEDGMLAGIITTRDLLRYFVKMF